MKLGFGGTKEEMQRLLDKAGEIANTTFEMSSFADIIEAIHVIQEDMGIMGATADEAEGTITGSTAAMKAAWQNLLVGISDDTQDFDGLIDNLVNSVSTVADNVLPRVEVIFGGLGQLVEQLFPKLVEQIPVLVSEGLPKLVSLATTLIKTLVDGLKKNSKQLASGATEIVTTLINGIADMLPDIVELGLDLLIALAEGISENIDTVLDTITTVVLEIVDLLTNPETLNKVLDVGISLMMSLIDGIIKALPRIAEAVPRITKTLVKALPQLIDTVLNELLSPENISMAVDAAIDFLNAIVDSLPEIIQALVEAIPDIIDTICERFLSPENISKMLETGDKLIYSLLENFPAVVESALSLVDGIFGTHIAEWYKQVSDFFMGYGSYLYQMTHENILGEQELANKYSNMQADLNEAALAALKGGATAEEAFNKAKQSVLGTSEELYAFDVLSNATSGFGIDFDLEKVQQWERNLANAVYTNQNSAQYYEMMGKQKLEQAQPLVVTLQMPSGVEVGRQYIEDINTAKRVDGVAY